jgi:hypothetical protein
VTTLSLGHLVFLVTSYAVAYAWNSHKE